MRINRPSAKRVVDCLLFEGRFDIFGPGSRPDHRLVNIGAKYVNADQHAGNWVYFYSSKGRYNYTDDEGMASLGKIVQAGADQTKIDTWKAEHSEWTP